MGDLHREHGSARCSRARMWPTLFAAGMCACLLFAWTGCTPQKRYQILSVLFDGVPDPNAPPTAAKGDQEDQPAGSVRKRPVVVTHKPFATNQCNACHKAGQGGTFEVSAITSEVCVECHKDITRKHAFMHAPVVSKACLWCHEPHDSPNLALLREPAPAVCTQCHEQNLLGPKPAEHRDPQRNCLDCHTGHGGEQRYFIRQQAMTMTPTTQPSAGATGEVKP